VFSAVFSAFGGFGVARVVVRACFLAGAALVRFMAGDADLARDVDDGRGDDLPVAFFAAVLADFFAVFAVAAFARFAFA